MRLLHGDRETSRSPTIRGPIVAPPGSLLAHIRSAGVPTGGASVFTGDQEGPRQVYRDEMPPVSCEAGMSIAWPGDGEGVRVADFGCVGGCRFSAATEREPAGLAEAGRHQGGGVRRRPAPCLQPGCPTLTLRSWCDEHRSPNVYEERRMSAHRRGYTARWAKVARTFLYRHPVCAHCGGAATEVDHVDGLGPHGPRGWDETNWQSLCKSCHSRKTTRERRGV